MAARIMALLVCGAFVIQLVSCGTLLYPERRGQKSGDLDLAVVLMDGIGLLFFLIPGIVAFAVDLHTGAIYLPPGEKGKGRGIKISDQGKIRVVSVDPNRLDAARLSEIVALHTGQTIRMDDPSLIVKRIHGPVDIAQELEKISASYARIASLAGGT